MNKKILFITTENKFSFKSGAFIYSESIYNSLLKNINYDIHRFSRPIKNRWNFLFFLFPYQIIRSMSKIPMLNSYDIIVVDHFRNLSPQLFFFKKKIVLVNHNDEMYNYISLLHTKNVFIKVAAFFEILKLKIYESLFKNKIHALVSINKIENKNVSRRLNIKLSEIIYPSFELKTNQKNTEVEIKKVIYVGSFNYLAKKRNLKKIISIFSNLSDDNFLDLFVIGSGLDEFSNQKNIFFIKNPSDISVYYNQDSVALVPELFGGGYKIKIAEAVSNRICMLAHSEAVKGTNFDSKLFTFNDFKQMIILLKKVKSNILFRNEIINNQSIMLNENSSENSNKKISNLIGQLFI